MKQKSTPWPDCLDSLSLPGTKSQQIRKLAIHNHLNEMVWMQLSFVQRKYLTEITKGGNVNSHVKIYFQAPFLEISTKLHFYTFYSWYFGIKKNILI